MSRIMVITPTTGKDTVWKAIESVADQTISVEHLLVSDGEEVWEQLIEKSADYPKKVFDAWLRDGLNVIPLPENVGGNGWYGHRVYAAMPMLVNADYILFLDEDNWFEPNHVETMIDKIKSKDLMWSYSLRRICNEEGEFLCEDDCESLGRWPTFYDHLLNFVDTNCYCFRREYLVSVAHHFYGQWGQDRVFYKETAKALPSFGCTGLATVNYRAPKRLHEMFKEGNEAVKKSYETLPWRNK